MKSVEKTLLTKGDDFTHSTAAGGDGMSNEASNGTIDPDRAWSGATLIGLGNDPGRNPKPLKILKESSK